MRPPTRLRVCGSRGEILVNARIPCDDTPRSPHMAAFSFLNPQNPALRRFLSQVGRSRFFTISFVLHVVLVLTLGGVVLVRQATHTEDVMDSTDGGLVQTTNAQAPAPDQVQPVDQQQTDPTTPQPVSNVPAPTTMAPISVAAPTGAAFEFNAPAPSEILTNNPPTFITAEQTSQVTAPTTPGAIPATIAKGMKGFTQAWVQQGDSGSGVGRDRKFKFTAFLAKYSGGDWDSTVKVQNGKVTKGSLPNLLYIIRKLSNDKIQADPDAVPLNLASDDLFTKKPPFVLFTGHQDFKLTDKEVENLQKYLQLGGCVWGDSSLPGNRSRFDLAFRREMKRVLPDQDIQWQELPPTHDLFTKKYWKEVLNVPPGLNYYQEPVYALKNFGEVVVIYTPNDYADMWQIALDEKMEYDMRRDEHLAYVTTNITMFNKRGIYFRNLELPELRMSYKFGTNIVLHLLTRWEDKLRNVPTGL